MRDGHRLLQAFAFRSEFADNVVEVRTLGRQGSLGRLDSGASLSLWTRRVRLLKPKRVPATKSAARRVGDDALGIRVVTLGMDSRGRSNTPNEGQTQILLASCHDGSCRRHGLGRGRMWR